MAKVDTSTAGDPFIWLEEIDTIARLTSGSVLRDRSGW